MGGGGGGGAVRARCTEEGDFAGCAGRVTAVSSGGGGGGRVGGGTSGGRGVSSCRVKCSREVKVEKGAVEVVCCPGAGGVGPSTRSVLA